jgi:hypothetical protein
MNATIDNDSGQRSLLEVAAYAALQRATAHANVVDLAMIGAAHSLDAGNLPKLALEVQRARELHRLFLVRLASIHRRVGQGAP